MKTFMTPDAPYRRAAKTCKTHNKMLIVCLLPVSASAVRIVSLHSFLKLSSVNLDNFVNLVHFFLVGGRVLAAGLGLAFPLPIESRMA